MSDDHSERAISAYGSTLISTPTTIESQLPFGPFYELETSSPALALASEESYLQV
jgi:hypothetical protein